MTSMLQASLFGSCVVLAATACATASSSGARPLLDAVLAGDAREVDRLVASGADPRWDPDGNCLLFAAIHVDRADIVELLVKRGSDLECRAKGGGATPLHRALDEQKPVMVSKLVALGADVNATPGSGAKGHTALSTAVHHSVKGISGFDLGVIREILMRGADPNVGSEGGYTPLGLAAGSKRPELVNLLLKHGANPNLRHGRSGITPLEIAVGRGNKEIASILLAAGADPKRESIKGQLLTNARRAMPDLVPELVKHGAQEAN